MGEPSAEKETQWAEPMADPPQLKDFRAQMEAEVLHVVQDYRGPAQYLQRLTEADRDEFAQYLWIEFKKKGMTSCTTTMSTSHQ